MRPILILLSLLAFSPAVQSYGGEGHAVFCEMTYDLVSPNTRGRLNAMVAEHPDYSSFGQICSWADHIKSDEKWDWAKPHHYVNFARDQAQVKPSDCPSQGCILSAIEHHYAVLWENPDSWVALAFLAHFVGDLHQPMHVSFADDLGGNRAMIEFYGEQRNLHWVWDTGMLMQRDGDLPEHKAQDLAAELSALPPMKYTPELGLAWANESAAITRRIYSDYSPQQRVGEDYTAQYGPILEQRMQTGAQRLAAILDSVYQ